MLPRKSKSPFKVKSSQPIRLSEIQSTSLARKRSGTELEGKDTIKPRSRDWLKPRRATRTTSLKELATWLGLADGRTVRAEADVQAIRLHQVSPRRFYGCMLDVARLNPRCLGDSAPMD